MLPCQLEARHLLTVVNDALVLSHSFLKVLFVNFISPFWSYIFTLSWWSWLLFHRVNTGYQGRYLLLPSEICLPSHIRLPRFKDLSPCENTHLCQHCQTRLTLLSLNMAQCPINMKLNWPLYWVQRWCHSVWILILNICEMDLNWKWCLCKQTVVKLNCSRWDQPGSCGS